MGKAESEFVVNDVNVTQDVTGMAMTTVTAESTGHVSYGDPGLTGQTLVFNETNWGYTPTVTPLTRADLQTCVVCGVEDEEIFVMCSLCQEAVADARKRMLKDMINDMDKESEPEVMTFHCGYTRNGSQEHAVGFLGDKAYAPRAACGVRVAETKRRLFKKDVSEGKCHRCLASNRV